MAPMPARRSSARRRHRRRKVMSEINVTPMVDVMLVLLIIFMVSAPLLTVGVPIDLPQSQAKSLDQDKEPLTFRSTTRARFSCRMPKLTWTIWSPSCRRWRRRAAAPTSASMCAATKGGLRDHDEGDGTAVGGRLPSGRLGHRIRAGLESCSDEDRPQRFRPACTRRCCCGRWCRFPARPSRSRRRNRCRSTW